MSIAYTYKIIKVDEAARCMEVVYSAEGKSPVHVGVRIPAVGESFDEAIKAFAPIGVWADAETVVQKVSVGAAGEINITPVALTLEEAKSIQQRLLADSRYFAENETIMVGGVAYSASRDASAALHLAHDMLNPDGSNSVSWKTSSGTAVNLTKESAFALLSEMNNHVQKCFELEQSLRAQVASAQTIDAVGAIVWPE
jgi:hypothetical protein